MSPAELWLRRPQNVWLRRAVFQVHLWSGIILGIYVFLVCLSGSAVVFRNDLYDLLFAKTRVAVSGNPLTRDQMTQAAQRAYPGYTVRTIHRGRFPTEATDILLVKGWRHKDRLFDPYQGRDIGPSVEIYYRMLHFASDLHGNLLFGAAGLQANAVGGFLISTMCVTGMVVWWPGIANWRRGMTLHRDVGWKRFNWDLHSAIGIWMAAFVLLWGITGSYLVFPVPFEKAVNRVFPLKQYRPIPEAALGHKSPGSTAGVRLIRVADDDEPIPQRSRAPIQRSFGDWVLRWFSMLHFGNFGGLPVKVLWCVLGLAPTALLGTGALMWWNRVLSREARSLRRRVATR